MFITLEGIEGSGKTTQIDRIVKLLNQKEIPHLTTREPGGTPIGAKIRSILLDPENRDLVPVTELMLYAADRAQHLETCVKPALDAGKTVICDRYYDATTVYQGFARGLDLNLIAQLHSLCCKNLMPDITFLLDLPPEIGLKRAWKQIDNGNRSASETRFEKETLTFHRKVREGYLQLAQNEPERFFVIDAAQKARHVSEKVIETLSLML
ncbi:dTMP kinase [Desulfococcaceae bacterium HSG9]|nr:dTMP kinase [Desulfococcaceae bacterium HSG9]